MLTNLKKAIFITALSLFSFNTNTFAQVENLIKQENSPYSLFGLGDLQSNQVGLNRSMGFTGNAFSSNKSVNFTNPASLASLQYATLHTGVFFNAHYLRNSQSSTNEDYVNNSANGSIPYLTLNLPIRERYNIAIGLMPYSRTSYNILRSSENLTLPDSTNLEQQQLLGEGEFYNFYIGNGYKTAIAKEGTWKNWQFAAGFNATYFFGNRRKTNISTFPEIESILGLRTTENLRLNDFSFDYGILLTKLFYKTTTNSKGEKTEKVNNTLTLGLTYRTENNLKALLNKRTESIYLNSSSTVVVLDSSSFLIEDSVGSVVLPSKIGIGLNYKFENRITVALDYTQTNWQNHYIFSPENNDSLKTSNKINIGLAVQPKVSLSNLKSIWKRSTYYFGGYYDDGFLNLGNSKIADYGLTFGLGFPIYEGFQAKRLANINLAFNVGSRGSIDIGSFRETYFKTTLGFTFNDASWFIKRKYN